MIFWSFKHLCIFIFNLFVTQTKKVIKQSSIAMKNRCHLWTARKNKTHLKLHHVYLKRATNGNSHGLFEYTIQLSIACKLVSAVNYPNQGVSPLLRKNKYVLLQNGSAQVSLLVNKHPLKLHFNAPF